MALSELIPPPSCMLPKVKTIYVHMGMELSRQSFHSKQKGARESTSKPIKSILVTLFYHGYTKIIGYDRAA